MAITQNNTPFHWIPIHQRRFEMIRQVCCKAPILKPIDPRKDEPIWVICDASKMGVGAIYGQGRTWNTCRPAGIMSKKFTHAQQNYAVHEMETLAILEALNKWEDKLIGYPIHIITDHKALEFFNSQQKLLRRQYRWAEYFARFSFDITYIKGEHNKIADCLSRYFENDEAGENTEEYNYVNIDKRMDPTGEDLSDIQTKEIKSRVIEIRATQVQQVRRSPTNRKERRKGKGGAINERSRIKDQQDETQIKKP